jgi:hypothetical protein
LVTPLSRSAEAMRAMAAAALLLGISLNLLTALMSSGSSSSSFGMMNQLQLIIVLPLLGSYIPNKVMDFIKAMNDSMFTFGFIPSKDTTLVNYIEGKYSFDQPNTYLFLLQLESGSAIVNVVNLLIAISTFITIHLLILCLYLLLRYIFRLVKVSSFIRKILSLMTFGTYIVIVVETFLLILFVVLNEASSQDTSTPEQKNSLNLSYLLCC